jgi:hypothetical protein
LQFADRVVTASMLYSTSAAVILLASIGPPMAEVNSVATPMVARVFEWCILQATYSNFDESYVLKFHIKDIVRCLECLGEDTFLGRVSALLYFLVETMWHHLSIIFCKLHDTFRRDGRTSQNNTRENVFLHERSMLCDRMVKGL